MNKLISFYLETERDLIVKETKRGGTIISTLETNDVVSIRIVDRNHLGEHVEVTTISNKTGREVSKIYEISELLKAVNRFLIYRFQLCEVKH